MWLESGGEVIAAYPIALGDNPMGHKEFEGDERTPEGEYYIDFKNPDSRYHLSLRISYPNMSDRLFARSFKRSAGGDIMIHGVGPYQKVSNQAPAYDWTDGCIAVTNEEIEEIWDLVELGTPIVIYP
jgi:murein L,D-transpeptidase YafK